MDRRQFFGAFHQQMQRERRCSFYGGSLDGKVASIRDIERWWRAANGDCYERDGRKRRFTFIGKAGQ